MTGINITQCHVPNICMVSDVVNKPHGKILHFLHTFKNDKTSLILNLLIKINMSYRVSTSASQPNHQLFQKIYKIL